jgi:hypothetical protein
MPDSKHKLSESKLEPIVRMLVQYYRIADYWAIPLLEA